MAEAEAAQEVEAAEDFAAQEGEAVLAPEEQALEVALAVTEVLVIHHQ